MTPTGRLRARLGVTQAELGRLLEVAPQTIAHYEAGRRVPTVAHAWRMVCLCRERRWRGRLEDFLPNPALDD